MENEIPMDEAQAAIEEPAVLLESVETTEEAVSTEAASEPVWTRLSEPSLLDAGFTIELRGVKSAMVIAPNHPIPITVEGLLIEHHVLPLSAQLEIALTADDRDVVRERFFLPTLRRHEVMTAHRELAKMSTEFLTDGRMRDTAMTVYFPELVEEYDLWYKITVDEDGCLRYALHVGPSHHQDIKKRIEGRLPL